MTDDVQKVEIVGHYYNPGGYVMAAFCILAFLAFAVAVIYGAATRGNDGPVCGVDQTAVAGHCETKDSP